MRTHARTHARTRTHTGTHTCAPLWPAGRSAPLTRTPADGGGGADGACMSEADATAASANCAHQTAECAGPPMHSVSAAISLAAAEARLNGELRKAQRSASHAHTAPWPHPPHMSRIGQGDTTLSRRLRRSARLYGDGACAEGGRPSRMAGGSPCPLCSYPTRTCRVHSPPAVTQHVRRRWPATSAQPHLRQDSLILPHLRRD